MPPTFHDKMPRASDALQAVGVNLGVFPEAFCCGPKKGEVFLEMRDAGSGKLLLERKLKNIITLDASILAARLFKDSQEPTAGRNNGLIMLGVGTGAPGNLLSPDAPQQEQRRLVTEIGRKAFSSTQFRNADGIAVAYPTHIVDFTATFGEGEAVGPWNEMGLMFTNSLSPATTNPIENGPGTSDPTYDPTIDVTGYDLLCNYLTFSVVTKPSTAVISLTWRLSF